MPLAPTDVPAIRQMVVQAVQSTIAQSASVTQSISKEIVKAMYDILGAYPRINVLPYWYQLSRTTAKGNAIAANATVSDTTKVSADAAFIATKVVGASTGDYLVNIRLAGSDRILMNEPIHSVAFVGTAERPAILPKPLLIQPNSNINYDLTDLSGSTNEVYLAWGGFKVYNLQQYGPDSN